MADLQDALQVCLGQRALLANDAAAHRPEHFGGGDAANVEFQIHGDS